MIESSKADWTFFHTTCKNRVKNKLEQILASINTIEPTRLYDAMRYSVLNNGKRLRPLFVYATGHDLGAKLEMLDTAAAGVELMHCYSLIHDDLPAMDNDTLRRGQPTCHIAYDEATAILAGDALQSLAMEWLAKPDQQIKPHLQLQMIQTLAHAIGPLGMAGGQMLDLFFDTSNEIEIIHLMKTAALFSASVQLGALAAGHDNVLILNRLDQFAKVLGIAFQIQDDLLDAAEKPETTSYLNLYSIDAAKKRIRELHQQAILLLQQLPFKTPLLTQMTEHML